MQDRLAELRKGRSTVVEREHTVILGWSQQIHTVISEIVEANANQPRRSIVVLAERDKVEMEDEIRARVGSTGKTKLVCRSGSPMDIDDLRIVSPATARSIVVLAPEGDEPDADVIKTILAITNDPERRAEPYHVVAEIRDRTNLEVARMVGRDEVELDPLGGGHRPHHGPDLPTVRAVGGLLGAARLRGRRDLPVRAAVAHWPGLRGHAGGLRRRHR